MVAAEGAACGALPVSAAHSGLAEVSEVLARAVPSEAAPGSPSRSTIAPSPHSRGASRAGCSPTPTYARARRDGLVATVREHWSWEGVARRVIAAAQGDLEGLPTPGDFARSVG